MAPEGKIAHTENDCYRGYNVATPEYQNTKIFHFATILDELQVSIML